jgi:CHC2 zinc finger
MPQERSPVVELAPELVRAYAETFLPRFDRYPRQNLDGSYFAIPSPLHLPMLEAHLKGRLTLGAYALDPTNHAKWLCLDADEDAQWQTLRELAQQLHTKQVSAYLEPSRRGGHLWLFFAPLTGTDARRFGRQLLREYHLPEVELYPKQDVLRTGPGSLVRLPLGVHQVTHKRYPFITPTGAPLAPTIREQIALLAQPQHVPLAFIQRLLHHAPEAKPVFPTVPFKLKKHRSYGDTPSERIKNRISVYDFVSQYVDLDSSGRGLCPFHDDHRESFSVNREGNYWHCFAGCGGGSVIDFWMRWQPLTGKARAPQFKAAIVELLALLDL